MTSTASHRQSSYAKTLRSSCRYCRRRKIRCDGSSPCSACSDRKIDCVHDEQARMGRPSMKGKKAMVVIDAASKTPSIALGDLLDAAFDDIFNSDVPTTGFSAAVKSYLIQNPVTLDLNASDLAEQKACTPSVYFALWPQLFKDLLDTCQLHYAPSLRQLRGASTRPRYLPVSLQLDVATRMASAQPPLNIHNKVISLTRRELKLLFERWSAVHPLSACVTFESLFGDSASQKALRGLIVCEAQEILGADEAIDAQHIYQFALAMLRDEQIPVYDDEQSARSNVQILLTSCQASILFAWRTLAHNQARYGTTFMALAGQLMGRLQALVCNQTSSAFESAVVAQIQTLSSYISLTTIWAFSQLDRSTGNLGLDWTSQRTENTDCQFLDTVSLFIKTLLNNHTDVISGGVSDLWSMNDDAESTTAQLLTWAQGVEIAHAEKSDDNAIRDMSEAIRQIVCLILIGARQDDSSASEFRKAVNAAIARMERLAGRKEEVMDRPVLARSAFRTSVTTTTKEEDTRSHVMKTLGAYMFEMIAAMLYHYAPLLSAQDQQSICDRLKGCNLDLVETESLRLAKSQIDRVQSRTMNQSIVPSNFDDVSFATPATVGTLFASPIDSHSSSVITTPGQDDENVDLYALLWGFMPGLENVGKEVQDEIGDDYQYDTVYP